MSIESMSIIVPIIVLSGLILAGLLIVALIQKIAKHKNYRENPSITPLPQKGQKAMKIQKIKVEGFLVRYEGKSDWYDIRVYGDQLRFRGDGGRYEYLFDYINNYVKDIPTPFEAKNGKGTKVIITMEFPDEEDGN